MRRGWSLVQSGPRWSLALALALALAKPSLAQVYSLADCRQMALESSSQAELRQEQLAVAELNEKAALAAMFPKFGLNAAYMWNSKSPVLLPNEMNFSFGTARVGANGEGSFQWSESSYMNQLEYSTRTLPDMNAQVSALSAETGQMIADAYQQFYRALNPDMTHVVLGQVGVTQPIYVGGRLMALYRIASATREMTEIEADKKQQALIVSVDEAYWRVVAVQQKKALAEQYYELLVTLEKNVEEAVAEGFATHSDLLNVKAKRGDAEVKKMQATNGLVLSKMALAQLMGLSLDAAFEVDESGLDDIALHDTLPEMASVLEGRDEMRLLEQAEKIAKQNVKMMSAGLQPNIMAQANYIYTNPSVENGFSNQWKGTGFFSAGVVMNMPIAHADDILRVKAAKHEAKVVALKKEEARELLTLQVTQANQKVLEAQQKVVMADMQVKNAEEVLRFAQEAYAEGMATASDLMQAQTAWLSACTDRVDAQVEAHVQETRLKQYTNTLQL